MKVCIIFALQQLFRTASFELFAEMSKSLFLRDKKVVQQQTCFFYVMARSKIPDMAGCDIPDTAGRKTRRRRRTRRRAQAIAKRYAFHANATNISQ